MILAIDTSTDEASVAAYQEGHVLAELSWRAGRNHSRQINLVVRQVLHLTREQAQHVSAIIVASGPGSFSGIRVGVSFAKGLGYSLRVPVIGIGTLDVIGFASSDSGAIVFASIPAGRNELYAARYSGFPETWQRHGDFQIMSLETAVAEATEADILAGPGSSMLLPIMAARGWPGRALPSPWNLRRAGFLAELGKRYLDAGGEDQIETLEPLYLRRSAAEEKRAATP